MSDQAQDGHIRKKAKKAKKKKSVGDITNTPIPLPKAAKRRRKRISKEEEDTEPDLEESTEVVDEPDLKESVEVVNELDKEESTEVGNELGMEESTEMKTKCGVNEDFGSERSMKTIDSLVLLSDEGSIRSKNSPYPSMLPTSVESRMDLSDKQKEMFKRYRKHSVTTLAIFNSTAALKQAVSSFPKAESTEEKSMLMFTDPDVPGFKSFEVLPMHHLDKTFSPLRDLPGIILTATNPSSAKKVSVAHITADQVFIADTFIQRDVSCMCLDHLIEVVERIADDKSLVIFKLAGEDDRLHFQTYSTTGKDRSPENVVLPLLDCADIDEAGCQLPIISDEYSQWIYIDLEPGFLQAFLAPSKHRRFQRKGSQKESPEESQGAVDANRSVMFKVYANATGTEAMLVVQTAEPRPTTTKQETVFKKLSPARGNLLTSKTEVGQRIFLSMGGSAKKEGSVDDMMSLLDDETEEDPAACGDILNGCNKLISATVMPIEKARAIVCSSSSKSVQIRRPILMLPFVYDESIHATNGAMSDNGGLAVYIETLGREEAPRSYQITRAATCLDNTEEVLEQFPPLEKVVDVTGSFNPADVTDGRFSIAKY
jgi:hypothetical protein